MSFFPTFRQMPRLVAIDTESSTYTRYVGRSATHTAKSVGGFLPAEEVESFRVNPPAEFRVHKVVEG